MKKKYLLLVLFAIFCGPKVYSQDTTNSGNTRGISVETAISPDSLTSSILLESLEGFGYSKSIEVYNGMLDSVDITIQADTSKNTLADKISAGSGFIGGSSQRFMAATAPVFFLFLLLWVLYKTVHVFFLQRELIEPEKEEAE